MSNYLVSLSFSITSSIKGNGILFFIVCWFNFLQFCTNHNDPFFFGIQKHSIIYYELNSRISSALSCLSTLIVIAQALVFNSFGTSSIRFILWSHFLHSDNFSNFFLLNKQINGWIYFSKSSEFIGSSSFPVFCCPLFLSSISCNLCILDIKDISWCCVLYSLRHIVNHIVLIFQFTSKLYLTDQSYSRNMPVLYNFSILGSICIKNLE